jgi:hypothetical protein
MSLLQVQSEEEEEEEEEEDAKVNVEFRPRWESRIFHTHKV